MPAKRRIEKRLRGDVEEAIRLFEEMKALPCSCSPAARAHRAEECSGCKRWWQLEEPLRHALDLRLWHFPTVSRHAADPQYAWPEDSKQARWLMLEQAAAARRQTAA